MPRTLHLYNQWHLGDGIFDITYFNTIKAYLDREDITIYYYHTPANIPQQREFIQSPRIHMRPLAEKPADAVNMWIATSYPELGLWQLRVHMHKFLALHFSRMGRILGLPPMAEFVYEDPDLAVRYARLPTEVKSAQILILNSRPQSGQYVYNAEDWTKHMRLLGQKYAITVTTPEPGFVCTQDYGLTIKDIAALSTRIPILIAVNSGPFVGCHNKETLANAKYIFSFDAFNRYGGHPKIRPVSQWNEVMPTLMDDGGSGSGSG